ncbi:MAG TPA: hypothetical protein PLO37_02295 [Candidatus Hydrogenedentes bacterium]|nr:hypothetical protein [Candidatus Hydrogenedentota bacterium]HPG65648.1 hypothetical protein [Candidatus Hydrogenedentota bacterium]
MNDFPRTDVGGVSVSRMLIGTNWFLGWSHCTPAKDDYIKTVVRDRRKMADVIEVFLRAGVDTLMGMVNCPPLGEAIEEAEDRVGRKVIVIATPAFPVSPRTPEDGFDSAETDRILDETAALGSTFCMPHQSTTDAMLDRCTRTLRRMDGLCAKIRERGMVPGLSTHMPESIIYADESGLDIETYIAIYNAMGFLMQLEVDWVQRIILEAKKPVMTIKPMAAGQLRPFQAMTFVWNSLRDCDMVTVGTMSPREAAELVELAMAILECRRSTMELQETRSKASVTRQP